METPSIAPESPSTNPVPGPKSSFAIALVAGIVAAVIGGIAWAVVTVTTEFQIGYMAIGVGFLVGFAVRLGHGTEKIFSFTGAALALLGCLIGNLLAIIGFAAKSQQTGVVDALSAIDFGKVPGVMISSFDPMDLLFYGIAVYEGYRFSVHREASAPPSQPATPKS